MVYAELGSSLRRGPAALRWALFLGWGLLSGGCASSPSRVDQDGQIDRDGNSASAIRADHPGDGGGPPGEVGGPPGVVGVEPSDQAGSPGSPANGGTGDAGPVDSPSPSEGSADDAGLVGDAMQGDSRDAGEGDCAGSATMDCAGTCGGSAREDACGECDAMPENDCDPDFILDMTTHLATVQVGPQLDLHLDTIIGQINSRLPWVVRTPGAHGTGQYDQTEYLSQVLNGNDTSVGVLVGTPYRVGPDGSGVEGIALMSHEDMLEVVDHLETEHPGRTLKACAVMPNDRIDMQLSRMTRIADECSLWRTVTAEFGPRGGEGYWLDRGVGPMMIQRGLDLGKPIFLVAKGFPLSGRSAAHADPRDVGPAARMFPDAKLVIQGSAFEHGFSAGEHSEPGGTYSGDYCDGSQRPFGNWPEGPYDESDPEVQADYPLDRGVNSLIASLRANNIGPNGRDLDDPDGPVTTHVYASLDGVWAYLMTGRNEEAQHVLGKLLVHVGEDRILWGTGSLWFGSPQPQIEAFRCFEISPEFQDRYGYPPLTQAIKTKIFGRNAARLLQLPSSRPGPSP